MESVTKETITGKVVDGFEIMDRFASGAFSVVHFAKHIATENFCAAKIVQLDADNGHKLTIQMREISVLMQAVQKHIVTLYHLSLVSDLLIFFLEYAPNGTLLRHVSNRGGLPEPECKRLFIQLFSAVRYLHMNHFVAHRDLKLENCLLDRDGSVVLADFGLCDTFYHKKLRGYAGSPGYIAPEVLIGGEYDEKCDIFSLGICLFTMRVGRLPFQIVQRPELLIEEIRSKEWQSYVSAEMASLIAGMVEPQPNLRFGIREVQRHPWMLGVSDPGNVSPRPIAFYQGNMLTDVLKLRRRNVTIAERALEEAAEFLRIEKSALETEIKNGLNNDRVAVYFFKLRPYKERPQLPQLPSLPQLVKKKPRPPVTVRLPKTPKRFTQGAQRPRLSTLIRRSHSDPETIEEAKKSPKRSC